MLQAFTRLSKPAAHPSETHQDAKDEEPAPPAATKSHRATDKTAAAKRKVAPAKDDEPIPPPASNFGTKRKTAPAKSKVDSSNESHSTAAPDSIQRLIAHDPTQSEKVLRKLPLSSSTSQGFFKWLGSLPLKAKRKNRLQGSFKTVNNVLK